MPRYIDADKAIALIKAAPVLKNICLDGYFIREYICDLIKGIPTAEVEPKSGPFPQGQEKGGD